jgi:putative membrane protein
VFWWWGPGWGWIGGLISAALWITIIIGAIVLLRRELPDLQHRFSTPPALRVLEERYAKGEITREEFLHRREVLMSPQVPTYQYQDSQAPPEAAPPPGPRARPPATPPPPPPRASEVFEPPSEPESESEASGSGAISPTYEPPQPPSEASTPGAEPTQPLPPSGEPE